MTYILLPLYHEVMAWEVVYGGEWADWFALLSDEQQEAVVARVQLLRQEGPTLGRPTVDSIVGSRHQNMKELRVSKGGALRCMFIFDPLRQAVLLLGGDKSGDWAGWYRWAIPRADDLYDSYLTEEGLT